MRICGSLWQEKRNIKSTLKCTCIQIYLKYFKCCYSTIQRAFPRNHNTSESSTAVFLLLQIDVSELPAVGYPHYLSVTFHEFEQMHLIFLSQHCFILSNCFPDCFQIQEYSVEQYGTGAIRIFFAKLFAWCEQICTSRHIQYLSFPPHSSRFNIFVWFLIFFSNCSTLLKYQSAEVNYYI